MQQEHPFAPFVRILGKGKKGSRSLDRAEAYEAMGMILDGQVRPEQLGAFLMLLRVKEEVPEELAGFADAVREKMQAPELAVDLDWATYAGKKRRHPWFLLSALCLAGAGYRVFMHGARGHTTGRLYTQDMLSLFNLPSCADWSQVEAQLNQHNFAFMSIDELCPTLGEIIQLRHIFGLRSPVHTLCRLLNPLHAPVSMDGVFHPPYAPMHQQTALLLGTQNSATIKGDGGEAEAMPDSDCHVHWIEKGELSVATWPRIYNRRLLKETELPPENLLQLWRGELEHEYGSGAVISTLALVLRMLKPELKGDQALLIAEAETLWQSRDKSAY